MLSVQTLARRIRHRLHDTDEITYSDEEILDCINCGVRFIRRIIARLRPALLMSEMAGILTAGENSITLANRPTKIISVTAGGKALEETELAFAIHKDDAEGEPEGHADDKFLPDAEGADALQNPHRQRHRGIGVGGQFAAEYGV